MSSGRPRYRTYIETAIVSAVIYIFLGAPGLPSSFLLQSTKDEDIPTARPRIEQLVTPSKDLQCPNHNYTIHIYSSSPLVLYIDHFLSDAEADHLIAESASKWQVSTVFNNGHEVADAAVRKSEKAQLARDRTVQCVEARALALQGWPRSTFVERLWTQRYNISGHYALHYDWAGGSRAARRVSSFMVYLDARCRGGGTHFPRLRAPDGAEWCEFAECGRAEGDEGAQGGGGGAEGVTFRPKKGAAVFWMNFDADGRGFRETIHAGLPVTEGTKVGLNIWTWYQEGYVEPDEL